MEAYDELFRWAQNKDIEWHGIEPREIPGRGIGIVATKPLQTNERLIHVPTSALRTVETIRPKVKKALPRGTKVHAILAADLALDTPRCKYSPWNGVIPSRSSIFASLPLAWDPALHVYLPKPASALLQKQQAKFARDWSAVQSSALRSSIPARQDFLYAWLLVNTRTFYHETPRTARLPRDDRMVLQPVADLFNHADRGCEVAFTPASFAISADREYAAGEEVYICYGKHSNDFLLVEYGFVMERNRWDEVCVDEAVMPELGEEQTRVLEERGFLGNYVLDEGTVCYRTQVAVRLLCVPREEWERLLDEGEDGGQEVQRRVDRLLVGMLGKYRERIDGKIRELESIEVGEACQRKMLVMRWEQIRRLIDQTIERLDA
ncbi:hypothetical protein VTI74DRAFT_8593 [Chaetomium olivicolor]